MGLIRLTEPHNLSELAILQSLLSGSGIAYVLRHAYAGSLYPGVPGLTSQVLIEEQDLSRAAPLLSRLRVAMRDVSDEWKGQV